MPEKKYLLEGWTIYEEVGIVVVNDYAVARISITPNDNTEANIEQFNQYYYLYDEEESLNDYLQMLDGLKIERMREKVPHYSIGWLEVE